MLPIRRAAVAGTWYPADADALRRQVDDYLARASSAPAGDYRAIVAPHAGLVYSGPVAAFAYRALSGLDVDTAVLVGPSHYVAFEGTSIVERGAFESPLGDVPIDEDCAAAIVAAGKHVRAYPAAHRREHSLEMQLPFLRRVLPQASIVPLVMGHQRRDAVDDLAEAMTTALEGRRAVIIASSDLSHYESAARAARLDGEVLDRFERFDPDSLMALLEANPYHACGGGPAVSVMRAARALGAREGRVLKYGDSGDVSGDKTSVVGYAAAAFGAFAAEDQ